MTDFRTNSVKRNLNGAHCLSDIVDWKFLLV